MVGRFDGGQAASEAREGGCFEKWVFASVCSTSRLIVLLRTAARAALITACMSSRKRVHGLALWTMKISMAMMPDALVV